MKQFLTLITILFCSLLITGQTSGSSKEEFQKFHQRSKDLQFTDIDSALYYAEHTQGIAKELKDDFLIAESEANLGDLYVVNNQLKQAEKHYHNALQLYKETQKYFEHTQIKMILGNIQLVKNNYYEGLKLYQECLTTSLDKEFKTITPHLYNNIGAIYENLDDTLEALEHFTKANELFIELKDDYNTALTISNISKIQTVMGKKEDAINGYLESIHIFSKEESWINIASSYNSLAGIYMKGEEYIKAEEYLLLALNIIENNSSKFRGPSSINKSDIYFSAAQLYHNMGQNDKAMEFAKGSLNLAIANGYKQKISENAHLISQLFELQNQSDSSLTYIKLHTEYSKLLQEENNIKEITQLKMQHEFDETLLKKQFEEEQKEAAHQQKERTYIAILIAVILIVIILVLLYGYQRNRATKNQLKKENLELEKDRLSKELDYKNKELTTNMMYLLEKNEFITSIAQKLSEIKIDVKKNNQVLLQQIINELKSNSSKLAWEEFELRFKEVHSDFYQSLNEAYPDLTPNEKKLCAFLKLNMSTKEISAITHQSVKSINMARFRLRKKMNMEQDENLISFLAKL